ncbi:hypothetical protein ACQ4LE_006984 [Meloidogyne hapla]
MNPKIFFIFFFIILVVYANQVDQSLKGGKNKPSKPSNPKPPAFPPPSNRPGCSPEAQVCGFNKPCCYNYIECKPNTGGAPSCKRT